MARKAIEHRMRGEGVRVQYVSMVIIREQAQAYLETHRELLDKATQIVQGDPGLRKLAEQQERQRERQWRKWQRQSGLLHQEQVAQSQALKRLSFLVQLLRFSGARAY
jgi:hypothetical protein